MGCADLIDCRVELDRRMLDYVCALDIGERELGIANWDETLGIGTAQLGSGIAQLEIPSEQLGFGGELIPLLALF